MSVKIMGLIWDMPLHRDQKLVLLAYADHADHEGKNIFPSISLIARKTGYSERQVQRITRKLISDGLLEPDGESKYGTNRYKIPVADPAPQPEQPKDNEKSKGGDIVTPTIPAGGVKTNGRGVTKPAQKPQEMSPDSSSIHQEERPSESEKKKAAVDAREEAAYAASPALATTADFPSPKHPALVLFKQTTNQTVPKEIRQYVIDQLGDNPDRERLADAWFAWRGIGKKHVNFFALADWYRDGPKDYAQCTEYLKKKYPADWVDDAELICGGDRPAVVAYLRKWERDGYKDEQFIAEARGLISRSLRGYTSA